MFNFFKRSAPSNHAQVHPTSAPARTSVDRRSLDPLTSIPTPEVTEGNDEADWSLWEDSVAFQDSQMPEPFPETCPMPIEAAHTDDSNNATGYDTLQSRDL